MWATLVRGRIDPNNSIKISTMLVECYAIFQHALKRIPSRVNYSNDIYFYFSITSCGLGDRPAKMNLFAI